jgi:hypothetical protein
METARLRFFLGRARSELLTTVGTGIAVVLAKHLNSNTLRNG